MSTKEREIGFTESVSSCEKGATGRTGERIRGGMPLRSLVAIGAQSNGGYMAKGAVRYEFRTKA